MFSSLIKKIAILAIALVFAAQAKAEITKTETRTGVYEVTVNAAGELATAIADGSLSSATTLILKTAEGVSLNKADIDALLNGYTSKNESGQDVQHDPLVKNGTLQSLNLSDAKCSYIPWEGAPAESWETALTSANLLYLTNFTYPKDMVNIPQISGGNGDKLQKIIIPKKDSDDTSNFVLAESAFSNVKSLVYLEINNCVTDIPANLCLNLKNLKEVDLYCPIKNIGDYAFNGCESLQYISLPEGLETIGDQAFLNCAIVGIRIPTTLKTIGSAAFKDCHYLAQIVIPENVEQIKSEAFLSCNSLKDVYVKNVEKTQIYWDTFDPLLQCRNLPDNGSQNATETTDAEGKKDLTSKTVNRESYWNRGTYGTWQGQSLLHIYDDKTTDSKNQELINEYKNRYSNQSSVNGTGMYNLQKMAEDGTATDVYWPSYADGELVENNIKYGAIEYSSNNYTAEITTSGSLYYDGKAVLVKVVEVEGNKTLEFYSTEGSNEVKIENISGIKIGYSTTGEGGTETFTYYDTSISTDENGNVTFKSDITPSKPTLYYDDKGGHEYPIHIEKTIVVSMNTVVVDETETTVVNVSSSLNYHYTNGGQHDYASLSAISNNLKISPESNDTKYAVSAVAREDETDKLTYTVSTQTEYTPDYRNWSRFVLAETYDDTQEFPVEHIIDDTWYTICVPFDVNRTQIETAFGSGTEVCEFKGVRNAKINNEDVLNLAFTEDLITDVKKGSDKIINANVAYMIHPNTHVSTTGATGTNPIFSITGIEKQEANNNNLIPTNSPSGSTYVSGYCFIGNYNSDVCLKDNAGSYFLAVKSGEKYPRFWRATSNSKGKWSPYTAIVKATGGSAKSMDIYLGDNSIDFDHMMIEGNGEISAVQTVSVKATPKNDNRVYNMQGVCVGTEGLESLQKGLYIINGKKYIVR